MQLDPAPPHARELVFARSLALLREFLKEHQGRPKFASPKLRPKMAVPAAVEGDPLTIKYQKFEVGGRHTDIQEFTLGSRNTYASLLASLQRETGFDHCRVFFQGKLLNPSDNQLGQALDNVDLSGLFLVQGPCDQDIPSLPPGRSALEMEVVKHFDDLWDYLGMQDAVASEVCLPEIQAIDDR